MTAINTAPVLERKPATVPHTARDVQRAGLRDLIKLATESAATEAEVEASFKKATEDALKEYTRNAPLLVRSHEAELANLHQEFAAKLEEIDAKHNAELDELNSVDRVSRERIERDFVVSRNDLKKKLEQAVWLAESVLEAAQTGDIVERKRAKDLHAIQRDALSSMEQRASSLLQLYGVQVPADVQAPVVESSDANKPAETDLRARYDTLVTQIESGLTTLQHLRVPRLFVGVQPYLFGFVLVVLSVVIAQASTGTSQPNPKAIGIGLGIALVVGTGLGLWLRAVGRRHVIDRFLPIRRDAEIADKVSSDLYEKTKRDLDRELDHARKRCENEVQSAKDKAQPLLAKATQNRDVALKSISSEYPRLVSRVEHRRGKARAEVEETRAVSEMELKDRQTRAIESADAAHAANLATIKRRHDESRAALERRLSEGLSRTRAPIEEVKRIGATDAQSTKDWSDESWHTWSPPRAFPSAVRFGKMVVDLKQFAGAVPTGTRLRLELPDPFDVPATLIFPRQASLLIEADRSGRDKAIQIIQMVMARLLTSLPPGRARFTIIDPVGLGQNFAGFMHLADYDDQLVNGRIWTDAEQIEQRLANLTEHMETVIQKYLRNEFATIDEYNEQAGELAEPYRILVVSDFPVGFQNTAYQRLSSIAASGARCGVYTIIFRDTRQGSSIGAHLDDLRQSSVVLRQKGDQFVWADDVLGQFPLELDGPPTEDVLTELMHVVGRGAKEAKRVELDFGTIAPTENEFWTGDATSELRVPVGRSGATRLQYVRLGKGVAQHMLIAGKTGSGKSTLLHALVTNLAMWYTPDQVEFYLIDFKKGVEFKTYASNRLPHARAVAVESDREFGLSVLQRLDAELGRRGELYRKAGVQDLAGYRATPAAERMPRTLLIIDEFQEFFTEDDKLAQDAALLLDRLVRQGRAFGVHVLLGSQTIGGTSGLGRSTIGQMAVRVALQCSEADSQMILGDNNSAARLLSRPGEAIYNDAGGLVENNSPFQVAWLPDEKRDMFLKQVRARADAEQVKTPTPVVFEGNAPADLTRNAKLISLIENKPTEVRRTPGIAYIGEPVAIREPSHVAFKRQAGLNVLMIGQQEESALAIVASMMVSLSAQFRAKGAKFYVLDGTPVDSSFAGELEKVRAALPTDSVNVEYRAVGDAMTELSAELKRRQENDSADAMQIFVFVYGLQRYRVLRKTEESFGFSMSDEPKPVAPDRQFVDLLREGPALGIHTIAWCDTLAAMERTFDRATIREFDHRILFQMSAADSSNLIDSPAANKLGFFRALSFSEEQGVLEKFRPYAMPSEAWLKAAGAKLRDA